MQSFRSYKSFSWHSSCCDSVDRTPELSRFFQRDPPTKCMQLIFQLFSLLEVLLAAKAVLSPGQSIEPARIDVVAAARAHAECALLNTIQGCFGHAYDLLLSVPLLKQRFLRQVCGAKITHVLGTISILTSGFISQTIERSHGLVTPYFEN